jgi:hypothetical protein
LCEKHRRNFHVAPRFPKKHHLGPQNGSGSFRTRKTAKNSKLPKLPENCFEPVGKGGWPPISTWCPGIMVCVNLIIEALEYVALNSP